MEITEEGRTELETILDIVINQIPNYFNLINPSSDDWSIDSVDDFVFGMVFNSFIAKSTEYLKNNILDNDKEAKLDSNLEYFETTISFFNENVPKIRQSITANQNHFPLIKPIVKKLEDNTGDYVFKSPWMCFDFLSF